MKWLRALLFSICCVLSACEGGHTHTQEKPPTPESIKTPRFKVYQTQNIWTLLLLDTRTGRLWQAQFSINKQSGEWVVPVQTTVLDSNGENGRFSLSPTGNMWTFILIDSENGALWHCQFGMSDERFCKPIDLAPKDVAG